MIACFLLPAGKSQSISSDEETGIRESISKSSSSIETSPKAQKKSESSTPITIPKENITAESQSVSPDLSNADRKKNDQQKDAAKVAAATSPAQGLAALKSLIAKAAAGTLSSKSSVTKSHNETATKTDDNIEVSSKLSSGEHSTNSKESLSSNIIAGGKSKSNATTSTSTSTSTSTALDSNDDATQENDYWLEEKLKMQNTVAYQSFQKGALLKKTLTSKGTSPPPQTISTQVICCSNSEKIVHLKLYFNFIFRLTQL